MLSLDYGMLTVAAEYPGMSDQDRDRYLSLRELMVEKMLSSGVGDVWTAWNKLDILRRRMEECGFDKPTSGDAHRDYRLLCSALEDMGDIRIWNDGTVTLGDEQ